MSDTQSATTTPEADLIARAKSGDQRAFINLLEPAKNKAWGICLHLTQNHTDARDALQEATALAWRNLDKFNGNARFSSWFYRIAANAAKAILRKRKEEASLDDEDNGLAHTLHASGSSIGRQVEAKDLVERILNSLPEKKRVALLLQVTAGLQVQEIADHLGMSLGSTKTMLSRTKAEIREQFGGEITL